MDNLPKPIQQVKYLHTLIDPATTNAHVFPETDSGVIPVPILSGQVPATVTTHRTGSERLDVPLVRRLTCYQDLPRDLRIDYYPGPDLLERHAVSLPSGLIHTRRSPGPGEITRDTLRLYSIHCKRALPRLKSFILSGDITRALASHFQPEPEPEPPTHQQPDTPPQAKPRRRPPAAPGQPPEPEASATLRLALYRLPYGRLPALIAKGLTLAQAVIWLLCRSFHLPRKELHHGIYCNMGVRQIARLLRLVKPILKRMAPPEIAHLVDRMGTSLDTVKKSMQPLERHGYLYTLVNPIPELRTAKRRVADNEQDRRINQGLTRKHRDHPD